MQQQQSDKQLKHEDIIRTIGGNKNSVNSREKQGIVEMFFLMKNVDKSDEYSNSY